MSGPRVLVAVPTTGGPLLLRRLAPRPGLPHPAAFAEGDYRPLALSADYRALAGPEGPVARRLGAPPVPHELRLSGEPDGGRSWEAPVALAHLHLAAGGALAGDVEGADLLLWATGALDLDLRLLPGDYALPRKVEASRALLDAVGGRRVLALLPPGEGRAEAALLMAQRPEVALADTLDGALALLAAPRARVRRARAGALAAGAALALLAVPERVEDGALAEPLPETLAAARPEPVPEPEPPEPEPSVLVEAVRAASGSSCRAALFDPGARVLAPVAREGAGFAALPFDANLCGVSLRAPPGAALGAVASEPAGALVAVPAEGALLLFLRAGARNVVYKVPVTRETGVEAFEHRLGAAPD